jgi:predicted nucleic acid binding AN1-type Zn finger protein
VKNYLFLKLKFKIMKNLKIILFSLAFIATSIAFSSCSGGSTDTEQQGKEYTSAYVCPMHCESSGSDAAGKCPICGMDYVQNENHKSEGHEEHEHEAEEGHEGHNH